MAGINRTTGKATDLITFSRASGGTALRKISYGSELVTNGTFDTDTSGWTSGNGATLSVVSQTLRITNDGVTTYPYAQTVGFTTEVGKVYRLSAQSISPSYGWYLEVVVGAVGSTATDTSEDKEIYFVATGTTTYVRVVYRGSAGTYQDFDNISVKEVLFDQPDGTLTLFNHPTNIPRIEYDAAGNVKGLLIEEARTNLVTYSEDFTNASWVKTGLTVTANSSTSPDGSMTADLLTSSGSGTNRARVSTAMSGAHSYSIFAKAGTGSFIQILDGASGNYFANFDIGAGVVGGKGNLVTSSISDVGNGWYRCTMSTDGSVAGLNFNIYIVNNASAPYGSSSTSPDTVYVYGAQLEAGSFPTSYIPTSGATATRAADIASISVDNFGYNQSEGTFIADYTPVAKKNQYALSVATPSGASEYLALLWGNAGNEVRFQVTSGGATSAQLNTQVGTVAGERTIHAGAYKTNDFAACNNGGSVLTDTVGDAPSGLTIVWIGEEFGGYLNGHIKSIAYYPRRLSNAQLQALTA